MLKLLKSRRRSDDSLEFEFFTNDIDELISIILDTENIHIGTIVAKTLNQKIISLKSRIALMELLHAGILSEVEFMGAYRQKRIIISANIPEDKILITIIEADDLLRLTQELEVYYDQTVFR